MRLVQAFKTAGKLLTLDAKTLAVVKWRLHRGDDTLRLDYPLGPDSIVFDVGGYRGEWSRRIAERFHCHIHVFEPVSEYCRQIAEQLGGDPKVVINEAGLAESTRRQMISLDEAASSVVKIETTGREIQLLDIDAYVKERGISRIDLIKINIEGGEYPLLARMHEIGLLANCTDVQVQFHDFVPDADARRDELRAILARTHELTYDYPFIWENWHLKGVRR
jgi:FkbM family methyltransferase